MDDYYKLVEYNDENEINKLRSSNISENSIQDSINNINNDLDYIFQYIDCENRPDKDKNKISKENNILQHVTSSVSSENPKRYSSNNGDQLNNIHTNHNIPPTKKKNKNICRKRLLL